MTNPLIDNYAFEAGSEYRLWERMRSGDECFVALYNRTTYHQFGRVYANWDDLEHEMDQSSWSVVYVLRMVKK